jgi:hypothetical protein
VLLRPRESLRFTWRGGVAPYSLEVARDRAFLNRALRVETQEPNFEAPGLAEAEGNYFWKILDATGAVVSETRAMKVVLERAPTLLQPSPAQVLVAPRGTTLAFSWTRAPAARGYVLLVGADAALERPVVTQRSIDTRLAFASELAPGTYHWRVVAELPGAERTVLSETHSFRLIDKPQPLAPELYDSEIEFVDDDTAQTFERRPPAGAKRKKGRRR